MSRKRYVVNLGLNIDKFSEEVIEDLVIRVNQFIENEINTHINLGRSSEISVSIQAIRDGVLTFEILLEVRSSTPIPMEYEVVIDRVISEAFRFIENSLSEVGLDAGN